jgi:hypothetical protein
MRPFREILRVLVIRDQLLLGWKIGFFIVCGALVVGSMTLARVNLQSVDMLGVVISHGTEPRGEGQGAYLVVRLDNGESVQVRAVGRLDFRPGQRAIVRVITTNFFGLNKHEFKGYLDQPGSK